MTRLRRVLDTLRSLPYAPTTRELARVLDEPPTYIAATLRRAAEDGLVVREERWWRLASARSVA